MRMGVFPAIATATGFFSQSFEALLPQLEPWVAWSVLLPSCSSWFICMKMWNCLVFQLPPHLPRSSSHCLAAHPLHPACLLPAWMNVSSLTPWLSDFHTVGFSCSSGFCLFLNLLLLFFWLCEAQCIYPHLHLGWK